MHRTLGVQWQSEPGKPRAIPFHAALFGLPLVAALGGLLVLWLLVVAPAPYFLFLLCGAPARVLARSPYQLVVWFENERLRMEKIPRDRPIPGDRMATSFGEKPVAATNLFVSPVLLIGQRFIGEG